jgi:hypothetical protein
MSLLWEKGREVSRFPPRIGFVFPAYLRVFGIFFFQNPPFGTVAFSSYHKFLICQHLPANVVQFMQKRRPNGGAF